MFSANQTHFNTRKDTAVNAEETGKFVWNLATWALREEVNKSAEYLDADVDEFERTGLEKTWSRVVDGVPMVAASPIKFECEYHSTVRLPGNPPMGTVDIVIGKVVGVHIADSALTDGKVDVSKTQPIARCGYFEYAVVRETFEMVIPGQNKALLAGMEGSATKSRKAVNGSDEQAVNGSEEQPGQS
jgi:flavin reductase (DIM6/NTAB) family NADH-FMN oxidoreductase RutF